MSTVIFGQGPAGAEAWPVSLPGSVEILSGALVAGVGGSDETDFVEVKDFASLLITVEADQLVQGYAEWSSDGVTVSSNYTTPFVGAGSFSIPIAARYARIKIENLAASTATLTLNAYGQYQAPSLFLFPAAAPIDGSFPAALVKSIDTAVQPDGDYVNSKADGTVYTSTTPLGAAGVLTTPWFDSDGWRSLEIYVATDQVSASFGLELEFTEDVEVGTPNARPGPRRTYSADDVARGFLLIRTGTTLDGFRVRYTNGGFAQGTFLIQINVRVDNSELPQANYGTELSSTNIAIMTRGSLVARNDANTYDGIRRSTVTGALRMSVKEHEATTPIKIDTAITMSTGTCTTAGDKIIDQSAIPTNATAVQIQASNSNGNASIYLATSQAGSVGGSAAGVDLASGQSVYLPIGVGLTNDVWAASSTGTPRYRLTWSRGGGV